MPRLLHQSIAALDVVGGTYWLGNGSAAIRLVRRAGLIGVFIDRMRIVDDATGHKKEIVAELPSVILDERLWELEVTLAGGGTEIVHPGHAAAFRVRAPYLHL